MSLNKQLGMFAAVLACIMMLAFSSSTSATPYASGIQLNGVNSSFILNQGGANVSVVYDGGATVVPMGMLAAGTHTFDATLGSSWEIVCTSSAPAGWTQISADATSTSFYVPCGVSVNTNALSPNFGKIYVSESNGGPTAFGRTTTSGIYMLNADASEAGHATGGINWTAAGTSSPFKSMIGPDDHLYVADFSNDLVYEFNSDMSVATQLIDASNKTDGQYVESIYVEGTQAGGDRAIYLVDSHYLDARRGLIKYDLAGNATATPGDTGMQYIGPDYFGFYPRDVARDSNGDWYMNQYRSTAGQAPPLTKFQDGTPPINTAEWEVSSDYTGAYGIDIYEEKGIVAYGDYYTGTVFIFDMETGAFVDSFDAGSRMREVAFDAVGNIYTVDNSLEWLRIWSPGGNWVATTGSDGSFTLAVPEPSTISLLVLSGLALIWFRRRVSR
ncbi:MAG: PEP-CTERM sorting domain-containing protein [Pirellulales bacterium]|nr:PEP-CTERM sorting domain-containing protein [Pirellulales bacterium]